MRSALSKLALCATSVVLLSAVPHSQTSRNPARSAPVSVGEEGLHHLVLENDFFLVYKLELQPGQRTALHRHQRDFVTVVLEDSDLVEKVPAKDSTAASQRNGEVKFIAGPFVHMLGNGGAMPAKLMVIELKRHWDVEVETCREPRQCVHTINLGTGPIAETTSLFTNGFVTAYRHRVVPGGSLTSSYYSAKGTDQIVVVALTDVQLNFGGIKEDLTKGQVYYSEATEVEASGGDQEARWVVVRIHIPKATKRVSPSAR